MALNEYRKKRDFKVTPEPSGKSPAHDSKAKLRYVIQKHRATALHYDFRLQWNDVMLSWAVPKGPSLNPKVKRLAVQVEDHPIDYSDFEGVIPSGEYGGGTVMIWDTGAWEPEAPDVDAALKKGNLKFTLRGKKLKGAWLLVRTRGFGRKPTKPSWLLIKHRDEYATEDDVAEVAPHSAVSKRTLAQIARDDGGDIAVSATGAPKVAARRIRFPSER